MGHPAKPPLGADWVAIGESLLIAGAPTADAERQLVGSSGRHLREPAMSSPRNLPSLPTDPIAEIELRRAITAAAAVKREQAAQLLTQFDPDEIAPVDPRPCDGCQHSARCATGLACEAFRKYADTG